MRVSQRVKPPTLARIKESHPPQTALHTRSYAPWPQRRSPQREAPGTDAPVTRTLPGGPRSKQSSGPPEITSLVRKHSSLSPVSAHAITASSSVHRPPCPAPRFSELRSLLAPFSLQSLAKRRRGHPLGGSQRTPPLAQRQPGMGKPRETDSALLSPKVGTLRRSPSPSGLGTVSFEIRPGHGLHPMSKDTGGAQRDSRRGTIMLKAKSHTPLCG